MGIALRPRRVATTGTVEPAGAQMEIGGNERNVSLCRKHFSEAMKTGACPGWHREVKMWEEKRLFK